MVTRGALVWCDLGEPAGSAPGKRRPVLVVQSEPFNRSAISTVVVAVITSNLAIAEHPGNVFLPAAASGLPKDSVVNVSQVLTIDRASLADSVGELPAYLLQEVDRGLRLVLGL